MDGSQAPKGLVLGQVEYSLRLAEAERLGKEYPRVAAPVEVEAAEVRNVVVRGKEVGWC